MLSIIAPPGCYGTYIARCLYFYCDPTTVPYNMTFDAAGSSHIYRAVLKNNVNAIINGHLDNPDFINKLDPSDTIVITSHPDHLLDYYNNQFTKNHSGNILEFLFLQCPKYIVEEKLKQGWNYTKPIDNQLPSWIIREFWSYWMVDSWADGYNVEKYLTVPHSISFCCLSLWTDDFYNLLLNICNVTNKQLYESEENIKNNHLLFQSAQFYHNAQHRIISWVGDIINNVDTKSPCQTILDEAYVQCLLRKQGYEIQCNGLNSFPTTALELKKITDLVI